MECTLLLPGASWSSGELTGTVIASVFLDDEADPPRAVFMLLTGDEPYYLIVDVWWDGRDWIAEPGSAIEFVNIVPATDHWQQAGGDY